jgi:hypothetical protein
MTFVSSPSMILGLDNYMRSWSNNVMNIVVVAYTNILRIKNWNSMIPLNENVVMTC